MPSLRVVATLAACSVALLARGSVDTSTFDTSVKPQDDFYQYVNGAWIARHPIPPDHESWGAGDEVESRNEAVLQGILEKADTEPNPGAAEKMVGDFYHSGMDTVAIDGLGITPLRAELDAIAAVKTQADLTLEVARLHRIGSGVCFGLGSEQDPKDSERMIAGLGQGGLGLPDRDYYFRDDANSKKIRDGYVAHVARMLEFAGDSHADALANAGRILLLETALAQGSKSASDLRDPVANYHLLPLADVQKLSPHFDWAAYLAGIGLPAPASIDIGQPEFLQAMDAEITAAPVSDWKAYFRWHLIHDNATSLSAPIVDENFAFYGTVLSGTPKMRDRWRRVLGMVDSSIGDALGQLYVAKAFPPESKKSVTNLVANIRAALRDRILGLEWMDETTRKAAVAKLDMLAVKVGYTDKWIDYKGLVIERGAYAQNVLRSNEYGVQRDLAKIGKPVDRTEWGMTPSTVNAYYNPAMNEIVLAAGILQPPYYTQGADPADNYGAIGSIIGHEMTHGFDDEGRQFDGKGNLSDWWSAVSAKRFQMRSKVIVWQFGDYVAIDGLHVNGQLTLGENIADLGGIRIAYSAYMKSLPGKPSGTVDGFTPQQRFFLSYASVWRSNTRPETLRLLVNTDAHSPDKFRVNGPLSNLDEFYEAFSIPEGSPMRRPPSRRVTIW